jgi:small-conductance mechanosensitive channel
MQLPVDVADTVALVPNRFWAAGGVFVLTLVAGWVVGFINRGILRRAGVPEASEGTAIERTFRDLGSSTVAVLAKLSTYFVWGLGVIVALSVAGVQVTSVFWTQVVSFLPRLFIAALIVIVGIVVGDKVDLFVGERLRGLKVPQVGLMATLAKYTVFYVAALVALGQLGIATEALLVMLFVYFFGLVFVGSVAFRDMLTSGAAGLYLLLNEPYGIGDRIRIGDRRGIVQEMDLFVTTVETQEGTEYIIPNRTVFKQGVVRVRE